MNTNKQMKTNNRPKWTAHNVNNVRQAFNVIAHVACCLVSLLTKQ